MDFAYPLRHNLTVLRNVSIDVKAGESVALVGPSGAGKSSVFALLLGLYTPLNGKVRFYIKTHELFKLEY